MHKYYKMIDTGTRTYHKKCPILHKVIIFAHTKKAFGRKYSYFHPMNQHWGACSPLRRLSLVQENLPGTGLETHRKTIQVSSQNLKFHNEPK